MSNTKNSIITRKNRLCYGSLAHIPSISLCYIPCTIEVRIKGMPTSFTFEESAMPLAVNTMASVTFFRSVSRINIDNSAFFLDSFVFNKTLELSESPLMNPFVITGCSSDVSQIFHNNGISFIQTINDTSADIVVSPSHKPIPFSRENFQFSLGSPGAFRLKITHKFIMLDSFLLNIFSIEPPFTTNCEIINPHIESENSLCLRADGPDMGECEKEECSIKFVNYQETFTDLPVFKINFETFGNINTKFSSAFYCRNTQNIILNRSRARKVISHGSSADYGLTMGFLNHPASLFDTSDSKLTLQSHSPQVEINKGMQFNVISNSHFPSPIDTEFKSLGINFNSFFNFVGSFNLDFSCPQTHSYSKEQDFINLPILNSGGFFSSQA